MVHHKKGRSGRLTPAAGHKNPAAGLVAGDAANVTNRVADVVAAVATPPGRGGVGIVRISGPELATFIEPIVGAVPEPRHATLTEFRAEDGGVIDQGICLYFLAPHSFTGEDVVELQGHGGPVVMDVLLRRVLSLGARMARPGEFTERAFANDRIDLAQAEAVADLINSRSERAARAAMRSLSGEFSRRVLAVDGLVLDVRVYIEASIDFTDEDIDFLTDDELTERFDRMASELGHLMGAAWQGQTLSDGLDVVLVGAANVGKSTLFNLLARENRAIVTDIPGTTRDLLHADIDLDGLPVRLTDTAGLRRTDDPVESIGVERAEDAAARADLVLQVIDASNPPPEALDIEAETHADTPPAIVRVLNKADMRGGDELVALASRYASMQPPARVVLTSAKTGEGIEHLRRAIIEYVGLESEGGTFTARRRHVEALTACAQAVARARSQIADHRVDLAAEELRRAHEALGSIIGQTSVDDLLGEIFGSFCIGK